jgi:hypothetical protein
MRSIVRLFALWLSLAPAFADSSFVAPTSQLVQSGNCLGSGSTATVTITIAAPGVVTWSNHAITGACPVVFTTSGGLPTGITASTTYWVVPTSVTSNTFQIATTVANALAGTSITTTGSQSGVQTGTGGSLLSTGTIADITGVALSPGDWNCWGSVQNSPGGGTTVTTVIGWMNTTTASLPTRQNTGGILNLTVAAGLPSGILPVGQLALTGLSAASTNVFLSGQNTFSGGTATATGTISCRRLS